MKEKNQKKNLSEIKAPSKISEFLRLYLSMFILTHKNIGAWRMIIAYYFLLYAFISLSFTIWVPVTSEFTTPTGFEKFISRLISGGMIVANIIAYTMMLSWRQDKRKTLIFRILFIVFVFYLNASLISRILYVMIRESDIFNS
ncbi:MAG: hypothetical protein ACPL7B_07120 [Candidatus Poribacteria bacterium]